MGAGHQDADLALPHQFVDLVDHLLLQPEQGLGERRLTAERRGGHAFDPGLEQTARLGQDFRRGCGARYGGAKHGHFARRGKEVENFLYGLGTGTDHGHDRQGKGLHGDSVQ